MNLLVGHEWIITKENELENEVHGFPDWISATEAWKLTNIQGTTPYNIENTLNPDDKLFSFFGRVNYNYKSKYLLTATFRADASSKFSEDNRWGFFPSAAVAWRISSESFMEGAKNWLDDLKLRFSYGTAGITTSRQDNSYRCTTVIRLRGLTVLIIIGHPARPWQIQT